MDLKINKISTVLVLFFTIAAQVLAAEENKGPAYPFIREGFVCAGIEGTVTKNSRENKWTFTAETDITDTRGVIKTPTPVEMLPSSTLEKIAAQMDKDQTSCDVRLWARVTRYSDRYLLSEEELELDKAVDKNYLFPALFIPMTASAERIRPEPEKPKPSQTPTQTQQSQEDSIIPADIMKKLRPKRLPNLARLKRTLQTEGDVTIVDRTGFVITAEDGKVFELDGLGRNIEGLSFRLLPCETLERIEKKLSRSPGRLRFRIAGIVTKHEENYYLLLQRAARTYNHGNFTR